LGFIAVGKQELAGAWSEAVPLFPLAEELIDAIAEALAALLCVFLVEALSINPVVAIMVMDVFHHSSGSS
jgi:hypothetical protein